MGVFGEGERGSLPDAGVQVRVARVGHLLPLDELGDDRILSVSLSVGGGGEGLLCEMRGGVAEGVLCSWVDEVSPLVLDGLAEGLPAGGYYLIEVIHLVGQEVGSLLFFDGIGGHIGEEAFTDGLEVVVIGHEVEDVVAVFADGFAAAGLFVVEFGDDVFVPVAVSPIEVVGRKDGEVDVVSFVRGAVDAAGVHGHAQGVLGGAGAVWGVLVSDGVADLVGYDVLVGDAFLAFVNHAADVWLLGEAMPAPSRGFVEEERLLGVFGHGGGDDGGVVAAGGEYGCGDRGVVDAAHAFGGEAA